MVAREDRAGRSPKTHTRPTRRKYRFGFVLTTNLGNITRYEILRGYADRDPELECVWAPVDYRPPPSRLLAWVRRLPDAIYWRFVALYQAAAVLRQLRRLDAVMVHQFESSMLLSVRRFFAPHPRIVSSTDDTPLIRPEGHPMYPNELKRAPALQRLRLRLDLWRVRRADLSIPMSAWAGGILTELCAVPSERVHAVPVGLDLERWPLLAPVASERDGMCKILFVGGDFERKGGALLLDIHQRLFADDVELHVVSRSAPAQPGRNVRVYDDISANDPRLRKLYEECDIFVLPTYSDLSPWVCLEAMASSRPVIATAMAAIPDMIRDGDNGLLIPRGDGAALAAALQALLDDPARRAAMGARGRQIVEEEFDAAKNVPRILRLMKSLVDPSIDAVAEGVR